MLNSKAHASACTTGSIGQSGSCGKNGTGRSGSAAPISRRRICILEMEGKLMQELRLPKGWDVDAGNSEVLIIARVRRNEKAISDR